MTTVSISLPDDVKAFLEAEMVARGYTSASEYVRDLIRDAQKRSAKLELEAKLLEGLKGPSAEITPEDWDAIEREAHERFDREQAGS